MIRMTWPMYRRGECEFFGRLVYLSPMEAEALATLLLNRGRLVTLWHLTEALYPIPDLEPDYAYGCVWQFIHRLRAKLPGLIETINQERACRNARATPHGYLIDWPWEWRMAA